MKKKIFAIALALCMVLTMMPSMAFAEGNGSDDSGNWKPDTGYERTPMVEIQGDVIPCKTLPASKQYASCDDLIASGCLLGGPSDPYSSNPDPKDTNLTKNINLSLEPGAEENTFYVLHPENTELMQESYQQFLYTQDGWHEYITGPVQDENTEVSISRGSQKIAEDIYKIEPVKDAGEIFKVTYTVGNDESFTLIASKITLTGNKYHGHNNIYSKFTAIPKDAVEEENQNIEEMSYAVVCLAKGMNITVTGEPDGAAYINSDLEFSEWAMDLKPSSELVWKDVNNETKSAFYANACAHITEGGQGRILELCLELKPGYILEKITDSAGNKIDYVAEHFQYLLLKDENEKEIIGKRFWNILDNSQEDLYEKYNLSPAANGDPEAEDSPAFLEAYHCFATEKTYASADIKENIGSENISGTIKFLNDYKYSVEQKNEYTNYKLYFNKEKDDDITGITFHIKKANVIGDEISVSGNDENKVNAVLSETETAATKDLLKKNLTTIGTDGYEVLDVYDITANEADVKGLYNITIPASKLKNANPKECKVVYYADGSAVPLEMETTYTTDVNEKANGIVFTTGHFSKYAVMTKAKSSGGNTGGGGFVPPVTDNDNVTNKAENTLPEKTVQELSEKTEAQITIKTDAAEVTLDKAAVDALAAQAGTTGTVKLVVETVRQDENTLQIELKLITSKGVVSDFKGGNVSVTVNLGKALAAKNVVCVYIDDNGTYHKVNGTKNPDGTYTFTTGHFSTYAVIAEAEAEEIFAQQKADADKLVANLKLKARSSKTAKGNIKVNLTVTKGSVKALEDLGYTVKYKYYRSTSKAKGYKAKYETKGKMYINTAAKKGTRYYYKARVMVYDANGNLVTKSELKQCRYASRVK